VFIKLLQTLRQTINEEQRFLNLITQFFRRVRTTAGNTTRINVDLCLLAEVLSFCTYKQEVLGRTNRLLSSGTTRTS
jgi:hypothetical protein